VGPVEIGGLETLALVILLLHHVHEGLTEQHLGKGVIVMGMDRSLHDFVNATE
jgi:hypothetical protein